MPIAFTGNGKKHSVSIPDGAGIELSAIVGQGGGDVTVSGHPLCLAPGYDATVDRSDLLNYTEHGMNWEISKKTAFFSPLGYEGP